MAEKKGERKGRKPPRRGGKSSYRLPQYTDARRVAHLMAEMPRHGIGRRVSEIMREWGVKSAQTVHRYVAMLAEELVTEEGEPQFFIEKRGGEEWLVRRPEHGERSERAQVNIYHLVSLYLSLEFFRLLEKQIVAPTLEEVMEKIERMMPAEQKHFLTSLPLKLFAAPSPQKDYSRHADVLEDVIYALIYQMEVSVSYKKLKAEELVWYRVRPLTLLYHRGSLYLVSERIEQPRRFFLNLERIRETQVHRDARFEYPANYHPRQMIEGAFGIFTQEEKVRNFCLCFSGDLAEYIQYWKVHESQKFEPQPDGSVLLKLRVTDSEEFRAWMRSFGEKVKMVE